jgi:membrane-associated protein
LFAPEELQAHLAEIVSHTGPYAPAVLFLASFLEHVFPPFPGDLLVILGAWYAVHGELSWPVTLLSVTSGAVIGAGLDWRIGRWLGARLEHSVEARAGFVGGLTPESLARFEASYRRYGRLLLVANRFVPGLRAFVFIGAGASRVPLRDVLVFGGISAALWNAALLTAGGLLAHNLAELFALLERYTRVVTVVLVAVVLLFLVRKKALAMVRRRRGA